MLSVPNYSPCLSKYKRIKISRICSISLTSFRQCPHHAYLRDKLAKRKRGELWNIKLNRVTESLRVLYASIKVNMMIKINIKIVIYIMVNNAILYNIGFLITYYCAFSVCESELFGLRVWISKWKPLRSSCYPLRPPKSFLAFGGYAFRPKLLTMFK